MICIRELDWQKINCIEMETEQRVDRQDGGRTEGRKEGRKEGQKIAIFSSIARGKCQALLRLDGNSES